MKSSNIMRAAFVAALFSGAAAYASNSATQTATYEVQAINEISMSGNPAALVINAAVAGSAPTSVSNLATTYAITTNESKKITAVLDTAMPSGVTLTVNLAAPGGSGTSAGAVTLTESAADVVTGISKLNESGKTITYELSATAAAGVVASATKTVTFTITS